MREEIDTAREAIARHLAVAKDGTAIHAILSTLALILAGPVRDPVEVSAPAGEAEQV